MPYSQFYLEIGSISREDRTAPPYLRARTYLDDYGVNRDFALF
jgi:hypothetical protein